MVGRILLRKIDVFFRHTEHHMIILGLSKVLRRYIKQKCLKLLLTWLEVLFMVGMVPRAGFETHCSPIFVDVLFVLKKRLYCSPSFAISRCQSLVSLSNLLSAFVFQIALCEAEWL